MILKEEHITSQDCQEVSKHGLVNIDLSQFAPIATVDSSLTGTERPSLTTINTTNTNKRDSSIVTGVLSPNANQSTLSPNSIGFGKKSPQLFGRVGLTDINPTPNLSSGGITNNNILVHLILLLSERLW
ncbi:hypothetical protein BY996DRAFT_6449701 [Phakopsora pachyrhizi]|nr:hypothetical protein BY996DRAFT_6449701 [Phakopsora pachyrhizi]